MANTLLAWVTKPGKTPPQGTCCIVLLFLFLFFLIVIGAERGVKKLTNKLTNLTLILIFKQNLMIS